MKSLVLELGCGKGEYSVGLAERYPDKILLELI
jgi:tRNA (guanine-N7-)-methyltransferase